MRRDSKEQSKLASMPIVPLVLSYSATGLVGLFFQSIWDLSDGYLIGHGLGEIGLSTVGIVVPMLSIVMVFGLLFSIGGSTLAAIRMGEGDKEGARAIFGQSVVCSFVVSTALAALGYIFAENVALFLGSPEYLLGQCVIYLHRFFVFFPFVVVGCVFYSFARLDGKIMFATLVYMVPPLLSALLEYVNIYHFGAGIEASATAFGLTAGSWVVCGFYFLFSKKTVFKVRVSDLAPNWAMLREIVVAGAAAAALQLAITLMGIILNNFIASYSTSVDATVFGVLNGYVLYLLSLFVSLAFIPGVQPIASYNYGAHRYERVRRSLNLSVILCVGTMGVLSALVLVFQDFALAFFIGDNPPLLDAAKSRLPYYIGFFALGGMSFLVGGYFQAVGKDAMAIVASLLRNVIILLPTAFIACAIWGGDGVWYAVPVCDLLSFAICAVLVVRENGRLKRLEAQALRLEGRPRGCEDESERVPSSA